MKYFIPNFKKGVVDDGSAGKLTEDYKQKLKDAENVYVTDGDFIKPRPPAKRTDLPPGTVDFLTAGGRDFIVQEMPYPMMKQELGIDALNLDLFKKFLVDRGMSDEVIQDVLGHMDADKGQFTQRVVLSEADNNFLEAGIVRRVFSDTVNTHIDQHCALRFKIRKLLIRDSASKEYLDSYYYIEDTSIYEVVVSRSFTVDGTLYDRSYRFPLWAFFSTELTIRLTDEDPLTINDFLDNVGTPEESLKPFWDKILFREDYKYPVQIGVFRGNADFSVSDYIGEVAVINPISQYYVEKNSRFTIENTDPLLPSADDDAVLDSTPDNKVLKNSIISYGGRSQKIFINPEGDTPFNFNRNESMLSPLTLDDNGTPTFFAWGVQHRYGSEAGLESVLSGTELLPSLEGLDINDVRKLTPTNKKLDKPSFPIRAITYLNRNDNPAYRPIASGVSGKKTNKSDSIYKLELGSNNSLDELKSLHDYTSPSDSELVIEALVEDTPLEELLNKNPGLREIIPNIKEVLGVYDPTSIGETTRRNPAHRTQQNQVYLYPDIKYLNTNSDIAFYGYRELSDGTKITIHPSGPGLSIAKKSAGYDFVQDEGRSGTRGYRGTSNIVTEFQTPIAKAQEEFAQAKPETEGRYLSHFPEGNGVTNDGFGITILVHPSDYDPTKKNGTAEFNSEAETRAIQLDTESTSPLFQVSGVTGGVERTIPGLGGGGLTDVRAMIFLYYDYSKIDLNKWVEDKKTITSMIPEGLFGYTDVRYSYLRNSVSDSRDQDIGKGFGHECFVKFTNIKTLGIDIDNTSYGVLTGRDQDPALSKRRPRKGKYWRSPGAVTWFNRVYWPMGDASWAEYFAPSFVASKSLKMFDRFNYFGGRETILPYYPKSATRGGGIVGLQPKFIQQASPSVFARRADAKFPNNKQSMLNYGYNPQVFHAKPTFYTFPFGDSKYSDFRNLQGRNAIVRNHIINFSETGILRQDFYSDAVSEYFNGLYPGTESQEVYNNMGLTLDNYPTEDPSERPVTQEFYTPLTNDPDPVTQVITRNPTEAIVSTIEGVFNTIGNFLQTFVMNAISRTGIDSRVISDDTKSVLGVKSNALVRVAFSEEGGGFITNVLNTENKNIGVITHTLDMLSRHRIILGYSPIDDNIGLNPRDPKRIKNIEDSKTVYCFSFENNRGYKGVTKWTFKYPIHSMKALDDHRILITFRKPVVRYTDEEANRIVDERDETYPEIVRSIPPLVKEEASYSFGIMDLDTDENTIYQDDFYFDSVNDVLDDADEYEKWFETLPLIDIHAKDFSPFEDITVSSVSLFVSGFIDMTLQVLGEQGSKSKPAPLRYAQRDNEQELRRYRGFYTARALAAVLANPTIRVTLHGNKEVAISSMIINYKSNRITRYTDG